MIGMHLIIDGTMERLMGKEEIKALLHEIPPIIGMRILAGPYVVEGAPENSGWTGFVIIDKSHIAVHTFDEKRVISIDVFSCKTFDTDAALDFVRNRLGLIKVNSQVLIRNEID
jgi:S-adenosylmethionine decarboxylase